MLKIPYALFMNAVMNNDVRELENNGYLNRVNGKVLFAFDPDFPKEKIPTTDNRKMFTRPSHSAEAGGFPHQRGRNRCRCSRPVRVV